MDQSSPIIFGLDILTHGKRESREKKSSVFSLAVLQNLHLEIHPKLSRRALFSKIIALKPDFLAMDNIFELSPNAQGIIRLLGKIPATTTLVQVTGNPRTGMEKLTTLARKNHLNKTLSFHFNSRKLTSVESAEVCARLCQRRVGHEIVAFEEEIRIAVSRKKSSRRGGQSAPRYERNSRIAVTQAAGEVERILRDKKASWELFEYPQRRVYIVQVEKRDLAQIQAVLKSLTTELVKVKLERITKSTLDFKPLDVAVAPGTRPLRNVILGIDPGTTTGIAVIDLMKGRVLFLGSKRECGISEIIREASKHGKISCVAADVTPAPATVEKVARMTGARLIMPPNLASASQKREYLQSYRDLTVNYGRLNNHERDALYGALRAFNSLKEQLGRIQKSIDESAPHLLTELPELQRLVLAGNSVAAAIDVVQEKINTRGPPLVETKQDGIIISLRHENSQLQNKIDAVYEELHKLDQEVTFWRQKARKLTTELKRIRGEQERRRLKRSKDMQKLISEAVKREVGRIQEENLNIRRQLRQNKVEMGKLRQIKNFWMEGREIPLKVLKTFSDDAIRETIKKFGVNEGDIVLVLDPSGGGAQTAQKIIDLGIRGVLVPEEASKFSDQALRAFEDNCIPFLQLPLRNFSNRNLVYDPQDPVLELLVYDGVYLTDIAIKEEIRKRELKLRERLRLKRLAMATPKSSLLNETTEDKDLDIDRLLTEFKDDYERQHGESNDISLKDSEEEE
ncbi:MAG: DUF460 domain-containing protein [Candidatus Thorarchaeota archaeon]